jgi:hypothetical protein
MLGALATWLLTRARTEVATAAEAAAA